MSTDSDRSFQTPAGVVRVEHVGRSRDSVVRISAIDTWSVMRTSFMLSLSFAIVIIVAVGVLWGLFEVAGVFDAVGRTADDIAGAGSTLDVASWLSFPRVMGLTLLVAVVEIVLVTAAATLFASLYNLVAGWVGGFEAYLSEQR